MPRQNEQSHVRCDERYLRSHGTGRNDGPSLEGEKEDVDKTNLNILARLYRVR